MMTPERGAGTMVGACAGSDLIARQIAIDLVGDDEPRSVVVVDEAGSEIYKAPVKA